MWSDFNEDSIDGVSIAKSPNLSTQQSFDVSFVFDKGITIQGDWIYP